MQSVLGDVYTYLGGRPSLPSATFLSKKKKLYIIFHPVVSVGHNPLNQMFSSVCANAAGLVRHP